MGGVEKVLYLAAHGGFAGEPVALGGGAAIFNLLSEQWGRKAPFRLEAVTPAILGAKAPDARQITGFNERQYARFCDEFRAASTERVLSQDPATTAVLVNDISEGPDFARLSKAGFSVLTVYHVDVVAYIARIYLRGVVEPWRLTRIWRGIEASGADKTLPRILKLIFAQQAASVEFSKALVVPSRGMKETLLRCYPKLEPAAVRVLPWGCPEPDTHREEARTEAARLRVEFGVPPDAVVLLALSRISPEKGQDLLLKALLEWERRGGSDTPVWLFICGEAAFMQGAGFLRRLRRLAARLSRFKVVFPGFVTGTRKAGFFAMADIYVFPSRHESYGLTLMEAMGAGLPCVVLEHDGSRESMGDGCGVMIETADRRGVVGALSEEIERLSTDRQRRVEMGQAGARLAHARPFTAAAETLASWLSARG